MYAFNEEIMASLLGCDAVAFGMGYFSEKKRLALDCCAETKSVSLPYRRVWTFIVAASVGLYVKGVCVSPIHGTNGNVEYLAMYVRQEPATAEERDAWIKAALDERPDADT